MRVFSIVLLVTLALIQVASVKSKLAPAVASSRRRLDVKKTKSDEMTTQLVISQETQGSSMAGPLCILGGALGHFTLGTLYCWGNFLSYVPSSLKFFDGKDHSGASDALFVIPFTFIAQALFMPVGPILAGKVGANVAFLIGTWLTAGAVYAASYFTESLKLFMFFYSVLFGAGMGLAYTPPMTAGWKWMPNAKGLVSGGILTGFGFGGFIFSLVGSALANPDKVDKDSATGKFPAEVYNNFPGMLRKLGLMYAGLSLLGSLLIKEPKAPASTQGAAKAPAAPGYSVKRALATPQFWTMWVMVVFSATAGLNTASVYKLFAGTASELAGDSYQASVGGIAAMFNGAGRLLWGLLSDAIGFKKSFALLTVMQTAFMSTYSYSTVSKPAFLANTCMLFFCLAGNLALMPAAVQRVFGPASGATIYGIFFSAFAVASTVGGTITKALAKTLGWPGVFRLLAAMSSVATLISTQLKPLPEAFSSV